MLKHKQINSIAKELDVFLAKQARKYITKGCDVKHKQDVIRAQVGYMLHVCDKVLITIAEWD